MKKNQEYEILNWAKGNIKTTETPNGTVRCMK